MNLLLRIVTVAAWGYAGHWLRPVIRQAIQSEDTQYLAQYAVGTLAVEPGWILIWDELRDLRGIRRMLIAFNIALGAYGLGVTVHYIVEALRGTNR